MDRATSAPAVERKRPEFLDDDGASMKSFDQELGEVVNATRKKFEVDHVPAEITLMDPDALQKLKVSLKEQVEAAQQAILVRKRDERELLSWIRAIDEERKRVLKVMEETRSAHQKDLEMCLDNQCAMRRERGKLEEKLEYVKFELKRRIEMEQVMETASMISHVVPERRIEHKIPSEELPKRKSYQVQTGSEPNPLAPPMASRSLHGASSAGEVEGERTSKPVPQAKDHPFRHEPKPAPPAHGDLQPPMPMQGGSPPGEVKAVAAGKAPGVVGGGFPPPPQAPAPGPRAMNAGEAPPKRTPAAVAASAHPPWVASATGSGEYVLGEANSKASALPKHSGDVHRSGPDYSVRGRGPVGSRSRSRGREEKGAPTTPHKAEPPKPVQELLAPKAAPEPPPTPAPALTALQEAVLDSEDQHRFWLEILEASTGAGDQVNTKHLREMFWRAAKSRLMELVPKERIPWNQFSRTASTLKIEGLNWKMPEQAFLERFELFKTGDSRGVMRVSWRSSSSTARSP